ncbi:MAG: hypothetical protein P8N14_03935 [Sulfitobacter sp.]|jgi:hypothetical protein|nr:hypothetical protein [Sulfitobacter sp.]
MSALELTKTMLIQGVWQGIITAASGQEPQVEVTHENTVVPDVVLTHDPSADHWTFSVPVPAQAIAEGVQTLIMRDKLANAKIGHMTLIAGEPLDLDIRAEMDLMRAELDMLKRAFRRHCADTE